MDPKVEERHKKDEQQSKAISHITSFPADIPSIERQLWHSDALGDEPFMSDGYMWRDKPLRLVDKLLMEIRTLRTYILEHAKPEPVSTDTRDHVMESLNDWVAAGRGDECFWESWPECPTEIELTPNMVLRALGGAQSRKNQSNV